MMPSNTYYAALMLQWGQRLSALDTRTGQGETERENGFNGANAFQRWILNGRSRAREVNRCFNGANAFQRWIHHCDQLPQPPDGDASMGPTPFSVGYAQITSGQASQSSTLQWGQRLSALDTWIPRRRQNERLGASMGPTPFSVGYTGGDKGIIVEGVLLQWGQRLSALDT